MESLEDVVVIGGDSMLDEALGLAHLPDGRFLPPMALNCVEEHLRATLATRSISLSCWRR